MAPFYGWGSTASRLVPLRGGSLLLYEQKHKEIFKSALVCTFKDNKSTKNFIDVVMASCNSCRANPMQVLQVFIAAFEGNFPKIFFNG